MTQEQDTSEQPKATRQRSARGTRRAVPEGGEENGAVTGAKPRRRTSRAAPGVTGSETASASSIAEFPSMPETDDSQAVARVRRTRVSRVKAVETPGESAPVEGNAAAGGEGAESSSSRKPRRRTVKAAEAADSAQAGASVPSDAAAQTEAEARRVRPHRASRGAEIVSSASAEAAPALDEKADGAGHDSRRRATAGAGAGEAAAQRPAYEDEGVVTHILPFPTERDERMRRRGPHRRSRKSGNVLSGDDGLGMSSDVSLYDLVQPPLPGAGDMDPLRSRRRHPRHKRKPGSPEPFAPEAFADMYPSSVLGAGDHFTFSDDEGEFEDDGPQPALPGQPSLALPSAPMAEEDLEALDEAVNGNRIDAPEPDKSRTRKDARPAKLSRPVKSPRPAPAAAKAAGPAASVPEAPVGKRVLYMSVVPDEQVEVVITDNGQVTEYFVEMAHQAKIRGNIYKGVINNIDTNLQAAFVNFGSGKNGFLQIDEVHPEYWLTPHDPGKGPKYPPIQKVLKVGQEVLVQVVKEPAGTKGAFLTTWVSLAGRFLVLTPGQEQIGVSRKVEDPEERTRLKELLAGIDPGENMGVIIRTASEGAGKTSIQKDLQYLKRLWKDIRKRVSTEKSPSLIYQEADLASRVLRDYLADDIREIWVDDESTLQSIRETSGLLFPRRQDIIKLHRDPRQTLWERFNLQRQLEEVTSREVILPSGGRLVFDQTEALMAIDINSGKTQGKSNFESMVFRTNMEAAEAIARHLRLRDIGGQVVIDFIEMRDRNHCREVEKTLRNAMRLDRARHDVGRMSSFGLLELVRQRTGTSAISISSEPCPHCRGTGVRRNMEWQALHALRDLQSKLVKSLPAEAGKNKKGDSAAKNGHGGGAFVYDAEPELGLYLLNKKRDRLTELEGRFGVAVEIRLKPCAI